MLLDGRDITGSPPHRICRMGMGRSFQRTNIFPRLTVFENVQAAFLAHRGRGRNFWSRSEDFYRDDAAALLASIGLGHEPSAVAGTLSYGNQKQLELGIALASDPRVLLLDEPTAGMSASETHETIRLLERIAGERGPDPAVHRARHGGGVRHRRKDRGAAPGPPAGRRNAQPKCAPTPRCAASISAAHA